MPGERHVFDSLLAAVVNQRERQSVFAGAAKLVNARAVAAFRSVAAGFLERDSIGSGYCIVAPDVALSTDDIERAVGLICHHSAQRVRPRPDKRPWRGGCISRASIQEEDKNASENNSEIGLYFHASILSDHVADFKRRSTQLKNHV